MAEKEEKTKAEIAAEEKIKAAAEKTKALDEAHQKYVAATETVRKEYVAEKNRIYPELAKPTPEQQAKIILELQEKVALLEKQKTEEPT